MRGYGRTNKVERGIHTFMRELRWQTHIHERVALALLTHVGQRGVGALGLVRRGEPKKARGGGLPWPA